MYKDILVQIDNAKSCESRRQAAIILAEKFKSHVTGMYCIEPVQLPAYAEVAIGADLLEQSYREYERQANEAGEIFRRAMDKQGIANEWRIVEGLTSAKTMEHGHYSDLVLLSQANDDDPNDISAGLVDEVVMGVGRPVLVVPYVGAQDTIGKKILLAWNGTRESVRALHDAMPLLQSAEKVVVMTVNPKENEDQHIAGADISLHLARHDVNTVVNSTVSRDIDVGDTLLSRASDEGVDLIVMGAYGHSRFRELVLGGATRHLLNHMTVPVLMSH
ncbi:MAG: universal stress protein [Proteobacteria bacterium]|nr:MAG: universal stress protein [Pseudomonadota bacterium]